jgi:hypothetical protein
MISMRTDWAVDAITEVRKGGKRGQGGGVTMRWPVVLHAWENIAVRRSSSSLTVPHDGVP